MNLNSSLQKTPIAVIGLSAMFADAKNIEEFWTNIVQAKDSIKDVPDSRWSINDYFDEDMFAEDKTYCKRGGFLPEIDFNPMEFGLPPNILEVTDASQLLGLVAARDALADAGYGRDAERFTKELKEKTGVLLGVGGGQKLITPLIARLQYPIWERALRSSGIAESDIAPIIEKMKKAYVGWNENAFPGLLGNVISGRITNRFDLGGINSVVDAACAASLSAIKMALSELVEGRCDMMLTGGVDTDNSPFMYMSFSKTPAFSKSGNISPFSDKADGMLIGEGLGMLVLKRLEDAERDGDKIYAVIKGVGTSSDGRFKSVYAPRPSGQALAMNRAYEDAGYPASTVGLIEAHGTGTGAGDPTEFTSMQMVFGADNPKKQNIALGSVKSQVGHTKAAAGAAGMIKAVLALHHKVLPPTINVEQPNSKFNIDDSAIYINTDARPWLKNGVPRRASVSAFGFGGINVHITMEEYQGEKDNDYRLHQPYKSLFMQATDTDALTSMINEHMQALKEEDGENFFKSWAKKSQSEPIDPSKPRIGFVAESIDQAISFLEISFTQLAGNQEEWSHPKGVYFRNGGLDLNNNKIAALFSGQGSQYVGMGKESGNAFPEVNAAFQLADDIAANNNKSALSKVVFPIPVFDDEKRKQQQKILTQTENAQPAIGTLSMGQYKVFQKAGFLPHFTAGHSFGELTALWAAGVYDDETFIELAMERGNAMAAPSGNADAGTMMAVKSDEESVSKAIANIPGVQIANVNSNNQIVLGGSTEAIGTAQTTLANAGFSVVPLPVSAAFHTPFVGHAQSPFAQAIGAKKFEAPKIPVYANTTAQPYPSNGQGIKDILKDQILNPVLFKTEIENLYAAGARVFIEFGPKGVLTNLVKNILKGQDHVAIAINQSAKKDSDYQLRLAEVQMKVLGLPLGNIDPYKKELQPLPPKSKLTVQLSGNNYVSPATQKAYTEVMNNGFKVSTQGERVVEKIVTVEKIKEVPVQNGHLSPIENEEEMMNREALRLLQSTLESFQNNQQKSLEVFERFMKDQSEQAQQMINLVSQQMSGAANTPAQSLPTPPTPGVRVSVPEPTPTMIPTSNGNGNGNGHSTASAPVATPAVAVASAPVASSGMDVSKLTAALLEVVSEKTGYPAEMLELSMDMEADLGIDSIKRVEIFGALTQQYPEMSGINPNELTELRTLQEIVDFVSAQGGGSAPAAPTTTTPAVASAPAVVETPAAPSTGGMDVEKLTGALLEVVSEKTGYPSEMLELSMDMEADLGIDSIKRVEIFGALTQQYPEMSGINPNELTELRTLQEIVDFVSSQGGKSTIPAPGATVQSAPAPVATPAAPSTGGMDFEKLTGALLEVVSEKTGYPSEMLELSMDMEADLGIDSIKRVEIFGALTQQYPEMSGINPNELTELRTLQEIVDFVGQHGKKKVMA